MNDDRYAWHDDYERECVMRAMCNLCNPDKGDCNECNKCVDHWLRAGAAAKPNEIEYRK